MSTTVTTIGGFVPLILFGGTFWPPLATAIAGGVAGSAIIALYTVPSLFMAFARPRQARGSAPAAELMKLPEPEVSAQMRATS
ncbi:MAG: efflux RND transporter permease subunit [Gammaproteobacteria bacterium]|nr:MAG: efflux RND transporter permease subunit [Gammaproteobacteria bacterium]